MNSEAIESKQSNGFNIDNEYKLYEEVLQSNFKDYISADAIEIEDNIYEPELFDKMIDCKQGGFSFSLIWINCGSDDNTIKTDAP